MNGRFSASSIEMVDSAPIGLPSTRALSKPRGGRHGQ
jgi:hypothetical protein